MYHSDVSYMLVLFKWAERNSNFYVLCHICLIISLKSCDYLGIQVLILDDLEIKMFSNPAADFLLTLFDVSTSRLRLDMGKKNIFNLRLPSQNNFAETLHTHENQTN